MYCYLQIAAVMESAFLSLPDELLLRIFQYLGTADLRAVARVCRRTLALAHDQALWKRSNHLLDMPHDIMMFILDKVPVNTLIQVAKVSRRFRKQALQYELWNKVVVFEPLMVCTEDALELQQWVRHNTGNNVLVAYFDYDDVKSQFERFLTWKIIPLH